MSSQILFAKEYEDFLLTGDESVCDSLPNGSKEKEFFEITRLLLKNDYSKDIEKKIEKFFDKHNIPNEQCIRLKALLIFKKMQKEPNKTDEIIKDIKNLFNYNNVTSHSKPMKYNKLVKEENEEKKVSSVLNLENYVKIYQLIDDIYTGKIIPYNDVLSDILGNNKIKYKFDLNKLPIDTLVQWILSPDDFPDISFNQNIPMNLERFKKLLKALNNRLTEGAEEVESFFEGLCTNCSNEHIEEILKYDKFDFPFLIKELIESVFSKIYGINEENQVKELKQLKTVLNKYKKNFQKYIQFILLSILDLNLDLNIYEFDIFIEYIELPLTKDESFYNKIPEVKTKLLKKNSDSSNDDENIFIEKIIKLIEKEKKIIIKYLKHFYLNEKMPFDKINKYFNEKYIKKFYSKMQFYLGNEIQTKDKILSSQEINELMAEIILNICPHNKKQFNINEDIELFLEIKNISQLYINIYEINTENYYYTNKKKFYTNISLEGITPTFQDKLTFNDKPQLLLEKKFQYPKYQKSLDYSL